MTASKAEVAKPVDQVGAGRTCEAEFLHLENGMGLLLTRGVGSL